MREEWTLKVHHVHLLALRKAYIASDKICVIKDL